MKGRLWRKTVGACLALLLVTGNVPIQPVVDLFGSVTITASAATVVDSGTCGENATWTLDDEGKLTISGTGDMTNYDPFRTSEKAPWDSVKENVTSIVIGDGVTSIGYFAFYKFTNLTSLSIAGTVTSIGEDAFEKCSSLANITVPASVTSIGKSAFFGCTGLTSLTLSDGVTSIGDRAFYRCTGLTTLTLPDSLTSIDELAFSQCTSLESVTIPESVTSIGEGVFNHDTNLISLTYGGSAAEWAALTGDVELGIPEGCMMTYLKNDVIGASLESCSLTLKDDIGLNAAFTIKDELTDRAEMVITIPGGTEVRYNVAKADRTTDGLYIFRANVNAQQMTEPVHFALYRGDEAILETDLTVRKAADMYLSDPDTYADEQAIVKALLNYGAYSQIYFGNTSTPANKGVETTALNDVTVTTVKDYQNQITEGQLPTGVTFYGSTLSLKSATELVLLFDSDARLSFEYNGETLPNKKYLGHQSCRIRGISIEDMGEPITITVKANGEVKEVKFSPLAHCYDALAMDSTGNTTLANWQNVIRALYLYYDAAAKYPGGDSNG